MQRREGGMMATLLREYKTMFRSSHPSRMQKVMSCGKWGHAPDDSFSLISDWPIFSISGGPQKQQRKRGKIPKLQCPIIKAQQCWKIIFKSKLQTTANDINITWPHCILHCSTVCHNSFQFSQTWPVSICLVFNHARNVLSDHISNFPPIVELGGDPSTIYCNNNPWQQQS